MPTSDRITLIDGLPPASGYSHAVVASGSVLPRRPTRI